MKYRFAESRKAKKLDSEKRLDRICYQYLHSSSWHEFRVNVSLDGYKLSFIEVASFFVYYASRNYGNTVIALLAWPIAVLVFSLVWIYSPPTASISDVIGKSLACGLVSMLATVITVVAPYAVIVASLKNRIGD